MIDRSDHISRKIALYSLYGFFLSTTFSYALAQNLLGLAIISSIVLFIKEQRSIRNIKFTYLKLFVFLFVGWSLLSAAVGPTPAKSLLMLREEWLFLMIPVVGFVIRDRKELTTALTLLAFSSIVIGLYAFWQHYGGMDLYRNQPLVPAPSSGYRVTALFSHRLTCGNYFAIASLMFLPLTMYTDILRTRLIYIGAFLMAVITVIFTYSRGPIAVIGIGIVLFLLTSKMKYAKGLGIAVVLIAVIVAIASPDIFNRYMTSFKTEWEGQYAGSRISIFRTAARMIEDHPLFGVGQGNFNTEYVNYRDAHSNRVYNHAHNDLLNMAAYAGIPAAIFFLGFWITILCRQIRIIRFIRTPIPSKGIAIGLALVTAGFFLTSLYEATFADEEIRLLVMALWGLTLAMEPMIKNDV
jgi:O-antigen ligase